MNKTLKALASSVASLALVLNVAVAPALAGTTVLEISGNGSSSESNIDFDRNRTTSVVQTNNADIDNDVDVEASTGDNNADNNTSGEVEINTGDVDTKVAIATAANTNIAELDECNCDNGDVEVKVANNGTESDNDVDLKLVNNTELFQENDLDLDNDVDVEGTTGGNDADANTNADVEVDTGDVTTDIEISTAANSNAADLGGNGHDGGDLDVWVTGNGSNTTNAVDLTLKNTTVLSQDNVADVDEDVKVNGATGDNNVDDNTGEGPVVLETGDVAAAVAIDNAVNFNAADTGCGCFLGGDILVKIGENGTDSDNEIDAVLKDDLEAFQENDADVNDDVDLEGVTGENNVDDNTVGGDDPAIGTGDVDSSVEIGNSGNANALGDVDLDDVDFNVNFSLNLDALLALLGMMN